MKLLIVFIVFMLIGGFIITGLFILGIYAMCNAISKPQRSDY